MSDLWLSFFSVTLKKVINLDKKMISVDRVDICKSLVVSFTFFNGRQHSELLLMLPVPFTSVLMRQLYIPNLLQISLQVKISTLRWNFPCLVFHSLVSCTTYRTIKTQSVSSWIKSNCLPLWVCHLRILWQQYKLSHKDSHVLAEQKSHRKAK